MTPNEEVHRLWTAAAFEVNFRTVTSRAYYACFVRCMAWGRAHGFTAAATGADHIGIARFLRSAPSPVRSNLLYRVGVLHLPKLKQLRSQADYVHDAHFPRARASDAVALMDDIMNCLDQVRAAST